MSPKKWCWLNKRKHTYWSTSTFEFFFTFKLVPIIWNTKYLQNGSWMVFPYNYRDWSLLKNWVKVASNEELRYPFPPLQNSSFQFLKVCAVGKWPERPQPGMPETCSIGFMSGEHSGNSSCIIAFSKKKIH